jgi:hypothetical protein
MFAMRALVLLAILAGVTNPIFECAGGQELAKPGEPFPDQENRPVRYEKLKSVLIVTGEVLDVDEATTYTGSESLAVPQLLLRVQSSFLGRLPRELIVEMPFPGAPLKPPAHPQKGDQVMVTLQKKQVGTGWICGRLSPCDKRPKVRWVGVEIYKRVNWP